MKLAIVYYSATGTVRSMAQRAAEAGERAGAEVRLRQVARQTTSGERATSEAQAEHSANATEPAATADDVVWADAVLFGSPTRYGNIAGQLKTFIDSLGPQWGQGLLADKVYAGFTASQTAHGGQESTLLALYNTIHHFGGIVVAPGYTDPLKFVDGNPYGVSHVTGGGNDIPLGEAELAALDHLATRVVTVAGRLNG
ncbi:flavodoxin family protein, partial [Kineococcus arenarius]|uniref:flavodoxin family protein n=1 Tax=Kineococcus sp. SYSU DK021 TaxID=3383142 RepID=UPI003D7E0F33